ncbi:MAG: hypothetical protein H6868_03775 [Rhodospirillales bacterium]|nr:hypothetical protein [Rhodospirillales bacterium]
MDAQWLKTQFSLNPDKSKAELARVLGLEPPAISKILAGAREIKAREYQLMRRYFNLPVDGEKSTRPQNSYVLSPLSNSRELSDSSHTQDDKSWIIPAGVLAARTQAPPEQIRIFSISENSMAPDFLRGEQVLVDLSDQRPSPPGIFVISDGVSPILRQCELIPQSDPLQVKISAHNKQYEPYVLPLEKSAIIGRVIAKLQWL